ncbi:hypothetical protein D9M70_430190 [compost metagenome]
MNTQASPNTLHHPRDYAAAILAEPSRERRAQLLERCPAEWREFVEEHVRSAFGKVSAYRQHKAMRAGLAREKPLASPRREDPPRNVSHSRSEPEVGNAHLANLRALVGGGHGH